jgi:competence protein ComEC
VANPNFLFDPGFQLSFTAVLSFVYIYPFFARKETALLTEKKGFFKQYLRQLFLGSLSVFLGLLPLQIYYFHSFHLWTILANLAVIPLVTVALGIGLFLISLPYLDSFLGFLNNFVLEGVLKTAAFFSRLPFTAISLAQPAFFFLPLAYFFLLLLFRPSLSGKNKVWLILLIPFLIFSLLPPDKFSRNLEAVFFDLGLGEAVYIKIPSGKNILIDGGGQFSAQKGAGLKVILPYLKSKGRNKINLIIVSHPHPDHLGGILEILEKVQVKLIALRREEKYRIPLYQNLLKKAEEKQIPLRFIEGEEILFISPAVKIKFFPPPPLEKKMERDSFINNRSLVFKLVYKNISFLFTGDIEKEAEEFLARTFPQDLRSTFLKIAHHGSQTSSGQQFLELVSPKVGILTTPPHWSSLPHPLVLARIEKFSFPLYRTDQYGAIIIQTDGERFKVKMMKKVDKKGKKGYN